MILRINKDSKKALVCYFLFLLYKLICDYSYYLLSSSAYWQEFTLDNNYINHVIAIIWITLAYVISVNKDNRVTFFFRMIMFFTLIPMGSVVGMRNESILYYSIVMGTFCLVEAYVLNVRLKVFSDNKTSLVKSEINNSKPTLSWVAKNTSNFCAVLSVLLLLMMYINHGIPNLIALDIYDVYTVRQSVNLGKVESYLMAVVTGVFVPFGIAEGVIQKKRLNVIFYTLVQVMLYLWTGNKIYAFSIFLIYFLLFLYKKRMGEEKFFSAFTFIGALGCMSSVVNNLFFNTVFTIYNRRMVLDSAALKFFYYDYFIVSDNPKTGFAGTILAPLLSDGASNEYRYALYEKYAGVVSNANTGIFGGDIASLGIVAFIVVPLLLIVLMRYIQRIHKEIGRMFSVLLFSYIIYRLNETCIFMLFFDFTGIALFLLVYLYKSRSSYL